MPEVKLFNKMISGKGYGTRPSDKPLLVTYEWVEVNQRIFEVSPRLPKRVWTSSELNASSSTGGKQKRPQNAGHGRYFVCQIQAVEGLLKHCVTKERTSPPGSVSRVQIGKTPNDRGHVIALQLGGVDDQLNIVPQLAHWQEHGEWREAEVEVDTLIQKQPDWSYAMRVDITYGRSKVDPLSFTMTLKHMATGETKVFADLRNLPSETEHLWQDKKLWKLEGGDKASYPGLLDVTGFVPPGQLSGQKFVPSKESLRHASKRSKSEMEAEDAMDWE